MNFLSEESKELEGAYFIDMVSSRESNVFKATIVLPHLLSYACFKEFLSCIAYFESDELNSFKSDLTFKYLEGVNENELRTFVDDYLKDKGFVNLMSYKIKPAENAIYIDYVSSLLLNELKRQASKLQALLNKASIKYQVYLARITTTDVSTSQEEVDRRYQEEASNSARMYDNLEYKRREQERLDRTYIPCQLKDVMGLKRVEVTGTIFKREEITTRKGTLIVTISYTDNTYSMISKVFEGKVNTKEFLATLKEGVRVKIRGSVQYDDYSKCYVIRPTVITVIDPLPPMEDEYEGEERRCELHLHTKMSAMDATGDVTEYFKAAQRYGFKALAITDHGDVQSFPEAAQMAQSTGIKALYGCELYCVDRKLKIAFNPSKQELKDSSYVVFDLETTGLSARYDRIIEFGATKFVHGNVVDEVDFFINPDMPLSKVTTALTHITDNDVRGGKPIKQALREIVEFCKDSILVAHNAQFDYGFLNEALKNNGMEVLHNPVIDTLPLSRYFFPTNRSHTLGATCRQLGVSYDETSAHRAIYDAQVLLGVWEALETKLINQDLHFRHEQLNDLTSDEVVLNARPFHVNCYAKNQQGLKELFMIVSDSNIHYLQGVPRVPRDLIEKYRDNLILGSACFNGEVFDTCMTKSEERTIETMKFYDFIEVQPPANYSFLVNDGQVTSEDMIKKIIVDMINAAKKAGKPVCATSDCHYVYKEDKIFRDVYVFAKGIKGVRHPLNPFRRDKMKYYENPDQHMRTTKEMMDEFSFLGDEDLIKEIVITNPNKVADMFEMIQPLKTKLYTPTIENCDKLLVDAVYKKAHDWYGDPLPQVIADRLNAELKGIGDNNYYVIYYIASKLVGQANADGFIVGSRGSVGSSLVATMSSITEVNPLPPHYRCPHCKYLEWADPNKYQSGFDLEDKVCPHCGHPLIHDGQNIPFATFLGFHAEKVPDIDLNFPPDYQAHAHELTKDLLGKDNVFKAGTIESVAEKNAIGYAKGYFEYLESHEELHVDSTEISQAELERIAIGCQGVKKTTGQHPGGIIVIPNDMSVYDFTPIQYPADKVDASWKTTHFDFHKIHDNVLKLDLLGHVDPMVIKMMSRLAKKNIYEIPFNDKNVMSLFTSPDALKLETNSMGLELGTLGMPEFGTNFVMNLLKDTKPRTFGDLLIISGLSHGTNVYAGNQDELIKNNVTDLRGCIGCRDDIMTGLHDKYGIDYSDSFQIMELVRKNNFTKPKNAEKRVKYEKIMRDHGVPEYYIDSCCKIQYLFPRGHAVAYCMMGVRVGWFKVYEPLVFYATYFTYRADQFEIDTMSGGKQRVINRINELNNKAQTSKLSATENDLLYALRMCLEMNDRGFKFGNISISRSNATEFGIDYEAKAIIPPFTALSGLGEAAAQSIVDAREEHRFSSIEDLRDRTKISMQKIEELKDLGALEGLPDSDQMTLF